MYGNIEHGFFSGVNGLFSEVDCGHGFFSGVNGLFSGVDGVSSGVDSVVLLGWAAGWVAE